MSIVYIIRSTKFGVIIADRSMWSKVGQLLSHQRERERERERETETETERQRQRQRQRDRERMCVRLH